MPFVGRVTGVTAPIPAPQSLRCKEPGRRSTVGQGTGRSIRQEGWLSVGRQAKGHARRIRTRGIAMPIHSGRIHGRGRPDRYGQPGTATASGFTLIELLVTIAIAAILLAFAVPSMAELIRNNRLAAATNELVTALQMARAEAVRRGRPVTICSSDDGSACTASTTGWASRQWLVFQDGASSGNPATSGAGFELIRVFPGLDQGLALTSPQAWLRFAASGTVTPAPAGGAPEQDFALVPEGCSGDGRREVSVSRLGRVRSARGACS